MPIGTCQVLKHLQFSGVSVPPSYEASFKKAILTFQFQRVYDPISEDIVHLSDTPAAIGDDLDFLGPYPLSEEVLTIFISVLVCSILFKYLKSYLKLYLNLGMVYINAKTHSTRYSKRGS